MPHGDKEHSRGALDNFEALVAEEIQRRRIVHLARLD
jgi:hypothetical protein